MSVVIVGADKMRDLNLAYRGKDAATEILSFPISKYEGEMFLSPGEARKEAKKFGRSFPNFLSFLFIHGCVHLRGMDHGTKMEVVEKKLRRKFKV